MPRRVLVADDEPLTTEMVALMLAFRGYEVVCATDGLDALARARETRPDLMLLDVVMPGLEGVDVARALRQDPELRSRPIVLFSCVDESEVPWRESGATLFLQKPIDIRVLPEIVHRLLPSEEPVRQTVDVQAVEVQSAEEPVRPMVEVQAVEVQPAGEQPAELPLQVLPPTP